MKNFIMFMCMSLYMFIYSFAFAMSNVNDTDTIINIEEVSVVSQYRNNDIGIELTKNEIMMENRGQEPSFIFNGLPGIFSYSDTGNEYGYSYFRMRGMDQTRINMTLDGMPLSEGEDMGTYFSNYPDMFGSMHSVKIENGASISNNGTAGFAGNINFESVNLASDTLSSVYFGAGAFNTYKAALEYNSGYGVFGTDNMAVHAKITTQQSDGYRKNAYNNSQSAFTKIGYLIDNRQSIDLLAFIGNSRNGQAWIGLTDDEINENRNANGCTDAETDNFMQAITKMQYKGIFGNTIVSASVYYNRLVGHYYFDLDNYLNKNVEPGNDTGIIYDYKLRHNMFGGNALVTYKANKIYNITGGMNAYTFNRTHIGEWNIDNDEQWHNTGYKNDITAFINNRFTFDRFIIGADVQYRHASFDLKNSLISDFNKINWDFINWNAKVRYRLNNESFLYASVTNTHREPTRSNMFDDAECPTAQLNTKSESVIDYELGTHIGYGKYGSVDINAYYMNFDDALVCTGEFNTAGLEKRINVNDCNRYGIELDWIYCPVKWMTLRSLTSVSSSLIKYNDKSYDQTYSPAVIETFTVNAKYCNFNYGIDVKYHSSMYADLLNNYEIDDACKVNMNVSYKYGKCMYTLSAFNILNSKTYSNGGIGVDAAGNECLRKFVDAPINVMASVRVIL